MDLDRRRAWDRTGWTEREDGAGLLFAENIKRRSGIWIVRFSLGFACILVRTSERTAAETPSRRPWPLACTSLVLRLSVQICRLPRRPTSRFPLLQGRALAPLPSLALLSTAYTSPVSPRPNPLPFFGSFHLPRFFSPPCLMYFTVPPRLLRLQKKTPSPPPSMPLGGPSTQTLSSLLPQSSFLAYQTLANARTCLTRRSWTNTPTSRSMPTPTFSVSAGPASTSIPPSLAVM